MLLQCVPALRWPPRPFLDTSGVSPLQLSWFASPCFSGHGLKDTKTADGSSHQLRQGQGDRSDQATQSDSEKLQKTARGLLPDSPVTCLPQRPFPRFQLMVTSFPKPFPPVRLELISLHILPIRKCLAQLSDRGKCNQLLWPQKWEFLLQQARLNKSGSEAACKK